MRFKVIPNTASVPSRGNDICYLWTDNWNDWFKYKTLYHLIYFDVEGERHEIGTVKIGQFGMDEKQLSPALPESFFALDEQFFSLGQDTAYYAALRALGEEAANRITSALKDIVVDRELLNRAIDEGVTGVSLLRFVTLQSIRGQFRRILDGGVELTRYSFRYQGPLSEEAIDAPKLDLEFKVVPESTPPTNIHVLIGRNGVGKTHLLQAMTRALVLLDENPDKDGEFTTTDECEDTVTQSPFANLVSVTFSAFDDFALLRATRNVTKGKTRYVNLGLRKMIKDKGNNSVSITRDPSDLAKEFSSSAKLCIIGEKLQRWKRALTTLQADPIFAEAEVILLAGVDENNFVRRATKLFHRMSSGHKIVLLTITKLVETVEEKTLVFIDEPEAHLHPPLLSAFVSALSNLLINRNGVAIIATHSPVVLQEVPASCVWKIVRHGHAARADRPEIETFAENVGILTREVFGFEVTRSGFHKMLADAVSEQRDMDDVLESFDGKVGSEGRALISSLIAVRDNGEVD